MKTEANTFGGSVEQAGFPAKSAGSANTHSEAGTLAFRLRRVLTRRPKALIVGWLLTAFIFLLIVPAVYFCWYFLPQELWGWSSKAWFRWIPGSFGFLFLFVIPIWVVWGASALAGFFADVSLEIEDAPLQKAKETVREAEQGVLRQLEDQDTSGLLPLLSYSRAQLDAYYELSLKQTRGSFFNAVFAMWLGFVLLLIGIALYVGPVEKLGLTRPPQDFNVLIVSGAAIVEFISALFLWVYRSTIAQLTYYYKLQMHSHTSILCFRMASTMKDADEAKRAIIGKMLEWTARPERPPLTGAKGLTALLPEGRAKAEPKGVD